MTPRPGDEVLNVEPHLVEVATPADLAALAERHGVRLDDQALLDHVIAPAELDGVVSSDLLPGPMPAGLGHVDLAAHLLHFDDEEFADALHAALKDQVVGYAMQLRRNGRMIRNLQWNWSRIPLDGDQGWTPSVRMHVASVSKLVTAMAMTKLLHEHGIPAATPIAPFLPTYWAKGPNVDTITFAELLTHTSGFPGGGSRSDYWFMKERVAAGVTPAERAAPEYSNMNFGLCRILLSTVNGNIAPGATFSLPYLPGVGNDIVWDAITIRVYRTYCAENLFAPAGVSGPDFYYDDAHALCYRFPPVATGWASGDLSSMSGGAGWHMSVDELLAVMGTFRRAGIIVAPEAAEQMLAEGFGIDTEATVTTGLGPLCCKGGRWGNPEGKLQQSLAYFLPQDMELVVLTNSGVGQADQDFATLVTGIVLSSIKPRVQFPIRGVLLAGGIRTQRELNAMSHEDMRNTLIVELTSRTNQAGYQAFDNDTLAGIGAALVFLRASGIRNDADLKSMSADDQRNTLIVELAAQTGLGRELQGFTTMELVLIGLGSDLARRGQAPGVVGTFIRGVLIAGGFRTQQQLNAMSADDIRNTLIVELTAHSNQTNYQAYNDEELAGMGAVMVLLRRSGIRDDAALKAMSADDQRYTLIVELDAQTGLGQRLQGLTNLELALCALGVEPA